jgi:hypothetical protein
MAGLEQFHSWRQEHPDIRVIFLRNWTLISAVMELSNPHTISDYYIVDGQATCDLEPGSVVDVNGRELKWDGACFTHLGSKLCEPCFKQGKLYPETCPNT